MEKLIKRFSAYAAVALMLVLGSAWAAGDEKFAEKSVAKPSSGSRAETGEIKPCIECHEQYYGILDSKHFVKDDARTPRARAQGGDEGCNVCHGDTSKHQKTPRVKGLVPVVFGGKKPAGPQNEACLGCHQSGSRIHWQGSAHERTQQACASCHKAHVAKDPVLVAETQANVCFDCHKDRRAEMFRLSTHPIKTGFFGCSSCHQPHGSSTRASLQKASVNDTCFTCHADKRGPFLWEHPSAKDDCTNCHNPHGTNNAPMLKVRMPYLCQQCHQNVFHPSSVYSGSNLPPNSTNASRMLGNSCTNCHVRVHGSNHPSGPRFLR